MPAMPPRRNALYDSYQGFYDQPLASRSSMLPFGTYQNDDGSESAGWAWPQMALDAVEAAEIPGRYLSGDPNQAVTPEDAQRTAINAAGLMMGGGLVAPKTIARSSVANEALPVTRAYHGTNANFDGAFHPSRKGQNGPGVYFGYDDAIKTDPILEGMSGADIANNYAGNWNKTHLQSPSLEGARVFPVDVHGRLTDSDTFWDAVSKIEDLGDVSTSDAIVRAQQDLAARGYVGIADGGIMNVFQPGTVRSATTGETLFSSGSKGGAGVGMGILDSNSLSPIDYLKAPYKALRYPAENINPEYFDALKHLTSKKQELSRMKNSVAAERQHLDWMNDYITHHELEAKGIDPTEYVRASFPNDGGPLDDALAVTPYEQSAFNQQIRQRKIDDGTLYSSGSPLGSGIGMTTQPDPYEEWFLRNMY